MRFTCLLLPVKTTRETAVIVYLRRRVDSFLLFLCSVAFQAKISSNSNKRVIWHLNSPTQPITML